LDVKNGFGEDFSGEVNPNFFLVASVMAFGLKGIELFLPVESPLLLRDKRGIGSSSTSGVLLEQLRIGQLHIPQQHECVCLQKGHSVFIGN